MDDGSEQRAVVLGPIRAQAISVATTTQSDGLAIQREGNALGPC